MSARAARPVRGALVGLALLALAPPAGGEAAGALSRGRELVDAFEFEAAIEELETVVADRSATAAQRIVALELISVLQFNLRRRTPAQQAYERLLALDPGHEPSDTGYPPRLLDFFTRTRGRFAPGPGPTLEVEARQEPPSGGPVLIEASLGEGADGVDRVVALVRAAGEESYRRMPMQGSGGRFSAEVPAGEVADGLEYYVQAEAPSGHVLATAASAEEPRGFLPTPEAPEEPSPEDDGSTPAEGPEPGDDDRDRERGRWYTSWWFWTIVGVAVAGGATTAVVLSLPPELEPGTLGTRSLP